MRAVNLIPNDQRRAGEPGTRGSGIGAYALLGALGIAVIAVTMFVMSSNNVNERRADLAKAQQETTAVQAEVAKLKPYQAFAAMKEKRVTNVRAILDNRVDWERVLRELSRVTPHNAVWLESLNGISGTGTGGSSSTQAATPGAPAISIAGCSRTQANVARMMGRVRLIDGVAKVDLSSSQKKGGAGSGGATGGDDCTAGNPQIYRFQMTITFDGAQAPRDTAPTAPAGPSASSAAATTTAPTTTAPSASTGGATP